MTNRRRARPPGSLALVYDPAGHPTFHRGLSVPGRVGNTFGDKDNFARLIDDVADTTLGAERPGLAEWRERGW